MRTGTVANPPQGHGVDNTPPANALARPLPHPPVHTEGDAELPPRRVLVVALDGVPTLQVGLLMLHVNPAGVGVAGVAGVVRKKIKGTSAGRHQVSAPKP